MPVVYRGVNSPPSVTTWSASIVVSTGAYGQPSVFSGQYFQATVGGTTGSTEPSWKTAASLPVPGTVFVDGSVTWTCIGSMVPLTDEEGSQTPLISLDVPIGTDPAQVTVIGRAFKTIANYFQWIFSNVPFLAVANTWTAIQTYSAGVIVNAATYVKTLGVGGTPPSTEGDAIIYGALTVVGNGTSALIVTDADAVGSTIGGDLTVDGTANLTSGVSGISGYTTAGEFGTAPIISTIGATAVTTDTPLVETPGSGPAYSIAGLLRVTVSASNTTAAVPLLQIVTGDDGTLGTVPMVSIGAGTSLYHYSFVGAYAKGANEQLKVEGTVSGGTCLMSAAIELVY
jgi:hypothetical protein